MATFAASIPASGTPVAGGIIFLPVLQSFGVCPRDAVAFSAITQLFGCGVFAPLNWLIVDPDVFLVDALRISWLPSALGVILALSFYKVNGCHGEHYVIAIFAAFCGVLALYVAHGLAFGGISTSVAHRPKAFRLGQRQALLWFLPCVLGGLLTGYIGISIEKVLFVLLTMAGDVPVRHATVTSITLVGWVSGIAFIMHAFSPCDPSAPQYIGAVPYDLWLVAMPGILLGSIIGPEINRIIGPRRILTAFAIALAYESAHDALNLMHSNILAGCIVVSNTTEACVPQHEDMLLGHLFTQFMPWLISDEHAQYMRDMYHAAPRQAS